MGIADVIRATLNALDVVEVRGKSNRTALGIAVDNLEALLKAIEKADGVEVTSDDSQDE